MKCYLAGCDGSVANGVCYGGHVQPPKVVTMLTLKQFSRVYPNVNTPTTSANVELDGLRFKKEKRTGKWFIVVYQLRAL